MKKKCGPVYNVTHNVYSFRVCNMLCMSELKPIIILTILRIIKRCLKIKNVLIYQCVYIYKKKSTISCKIQCLFVNNVASETINRRENIVRANS
jgi:hypothetical protein